MQSVVPGVVNLEEEVIIHMTKSEPGGPTIKHEDTTIGSFCDMFSGQRTSRFNEFLSIFVLPPVYNDDPVNPQNTTSFLLQSPALCARLSSLLHIDPWFFTSDAWNANGFFMKHEPWNLSGLKCHNSVSRFLVKKLDGPIDDPNARKDAYKWLFVSFCTILVEDGRGQGSHIVVCFDDCEEILDEILKSCKTYLSSDARLHPLAMQDVLTRTLIREYDKELWQFRKPVRKIEKNRQRFLEDISTSGANDQAPDEDGMMREYATTAEISRHIIHMRETLQVAGRVVGSILETRKSARNNDNEWNTAATEEIYESLRFSRDFLGNLQLRADAFVDRLQNEIALVYNTVSVKSLKYTQQLAKESRDESREITKILALVTLMFFPSTVVSGFFGMNFFVPAQDDSGKIRATDDLWIFFVVAIVLTAVPFLILSRYRGLNLLPKLSWPIMGGRNETKDALKDAERQS